MSDFLERLKAGPLLTDGAMGSYVFELTGRLSEPNHVYEALNVHNPSIIRGVHLANLYAGARAITTNTFDANLENLERLGVRGHVEEFNRAGVRVAREAIAEFTRETASTEQCFVLGSIGPSYELGETPGEVRENYSDQVAALISEGADALLLETFTSLEQAESLLGLIQSFPGAPPVIVHMVVGLSGDGAHWHQDPREFIERVADAGASVVGVNCCGPWEATAFVDAAQDADAVKSGRVLLSAMPNAGGFERIGHRYMSRVNPDFMGRLARTFSERGVRLLGGCCEVHPEYIREMHNYLRGRQAGAIHFDSLPLKTVPPTGDEEKKENGPFSRKIKEGRFAVSLEMVPPRGTGPTTLQDKVDFIRDLAASGLADAIDITDGSRGIPLMPPADLISITRHRLGWSDTTDGLELIPHFTSRDLNLMGMQSRLIGYHALGIRNVLFITGDPPKMSPTYPRSTAVFDLDSVGMIRAAHFNLNSGVDLGGQPLGRQEDPRTRFTIGSGFEPEALNLENEIDKLRRKIEGGADYIMTQPAFRPQVLDILQPFRSQVPILVGVMVLTSLDHAQRIGEVPGVVIPQYVYDRLGSYDRVEDQAKAGHEIAVQQACRVKEEGWSGLYLMSPARYRQAFDILKEAS
ncbi:MAG: homocysteine S-methyltransferase family protein [Dehalococcoidia bacterium]